jgi:hypothetical protein
MKCSSPHASLVVVVLACLSASTLGGDRAAAAKKPTTQITARTTSPIKDISAGGEAGGDPMLMTEGGGGGSNDFWVHLVGINHNLSGAATNGPYGYQTAFVMQVRQGDTGAQVDEVNETNYQGPDHGVLSGVPANGTWRADLGAQYHIWDDGGFLDLNNWSVSNSGDWEMFWELANDDGGTAMLMFSVYQTWEIWPGDDVDPTYPGTYHTTWTYFQEDAERTEND